MGCNVHAYIEYEQPDGSPQHLGKVQIKRDYYLFFLIAGVRGEVSGELPVVPKKGLPEKMHWRLCEEAYLCVVDGDEVPPNCCSRDNAEKWGAAYVDDAKRYIRNPHYGSHTWLTLDEVEEVIRRFEARRVPNYIQLKDHEDVPDGYKLDVDKWMGYRLAYNSQASAAVPVEFLAIRGAMRELDAVGAKPKLILWFDNE